MSRTDLCWMTATELRRRIEAREVSVADVVEAHLAQIDRVNPRVNAVVTLTAERARAAARAADAAIARGEPGGPLRGLPVAHKDLVPTRGIRTTYGSPIYRDHVPDADGLIVERLRAAGAITVGKTNTPEFGAGSQTFNEVFGRDPEPLRPDQDVWRLERGAAVALACGMVPIADGSDMGGSLRNPAAFCNVVGFRTAPGRVPVWPRETAWSPFSVQGPMARTVEDVALMLSAIAGPDARSPIAVAEPGARFRAPLGRDFRGVRMAWSRDLGGLPSTAVSRPCSTRGGGVRGARGPGRRRTAGPQRRRRDLPGLAGLVVRHEVRPDAGGAPPPDEGHRHLEHRGGPKLTGRDIGEAEVKRTALYHRVREFMERHEFLLLPATQVPPFDVTTPYITEINGVSLPTYVDWMRACSDITVTGLPAISVPAGFTDDGLPVGLQIVGRHQDEWGVLQLARAFEEATGFGRRRPALAG